MSTGNSDERHMAVTRWNKSTPPGVDDVRNKICWICQEEEASERPRRAWIHACNCSLVAHESCLLTWIKVKDNSADIVNQKCPQCNTPFDIVTQESKYLKYLQQIDKLVAIATRYTAVIGISGTILCLSAEYGALTMRLFLGKDLFPIIVGGFDPRTWRVESLVYLPLLPLTLLVNRADIFGIFYVTAPFMRTGTRALNFDPAFLSFPPSPPVLLMMMPFIHRLYRNTMNRLQKRFICGWSRRGERRRAGRDNGVADGAAEAAPGQAPNAQENGEVIFERNFTVDGAARALIGILLLPPISALIGEALLALSSHSSLLRSFIGVGKLSFKVVPRNSATKGIISLYQRLSSGRTYSDFDPVWWRNTVGLSIFVACRDGLDLWRRALKSKKRFHVIGKPFTMLDQSSLDLIIE